MRSKYDVSTLLLFRSDLFNPLNKLLIGEGFSMLHPLGKFLLAHWKRRRKGFGFGL